MTCLVPSGAAIRMITWNRPPDALRTTWIVLRGFLIAFAGGGLFTLLDFPAAWVAGSTVAVTFAVLARLEVAMPVRLRNVLFVFLGISMGGGVTPDTVHRLPQWPVSLTILTVTMALVTAGSYWWFRKVGGWDRMTALTASVPGALSYVMVIALDRGADLRKVAIAQTLRIMVLVVIVPLAVTGFGHASAAAAPAAPEGSWLDLAVLIGAGCAAGLLAEWIRVPAGLLTGAFLASALLHGAGFVAASLPPVLLVPCFLGVGVMIGGRFAGTDRATLRASFALAAGGFVVGSVLATIGAFLTVLAIGVGWGQSVLAFAPGGLEAMSALSFALAVDPAFVAAHQLFRFIGIAIVMPAVIGLIDRADGPPPAR